MQISLWQQCLRQLENELSPQQYNTWIRPLQAVEEGEKLEILAPNRFVLDWIRDKYHARIQSILDGLSPSRTVPLSIGVGSLPSTGKNSPPSPRAIGERRAQEPAAKRSSGLKADFTFDSFVEGKSNQLARAASLQVSENAGKAYNPLFICGGVGLGKTHLMHAVGNLILEFGKVPPLRNW